MSPILEALHALGADCRERGMSEDETLDEAVALGLLVPHPCPRCVGLGCATCEWLGAVFTVPETMEVET